MSSGISDLDRSLVAPTLPAGLDTPCVVVDADVLRQNVERMQSAQDQAGVALRPHLKTSKSIEVAQMAVSAGAAGVTVATLGEAEIFATHGIDDIFIAYPMLPIGPKSRRLRALAERCRLSIGTDSLDGVTAIAAALGGDADRVGVLAEVDPGEHRTGVAPVAAGGLIASILAAGLRFDGVFTHGGHSYSGVDAVEPAADDEVEALRIASDAARTLGLDVGALRWSAGSTPTALRSNRPPVNEQRPGTYVFNDRHQAALGAAPPGSHALVVAATVISAPRPGECVLDAGAKALAKDRAPYVAGFGVIVDLPGAVITAVHDHHATVRLDDAPTPIVGQQVAIIPNHVCPVVNLTDRLLVVSNGVHVDTWRVATRGAH